ncbi:helix-turn-helix domain-containing protein [Lactobacillus helveticus]|uniref:helix-turn-helix domain-containing protein n=1 Tax=Lactobacillus helveticus TaxID=1587 RepID=UPI000D7CD1E8|nr:helix-turn-helix domain-containing protein [Lactobacillus helveticus]NRO50423.1 hypothetical protein [Lactobacillus helveticus]NRO65029.1 hypothetical protein [Lactobacillus helveticus]NRO68886.1 hypothetical protein [Lactobacillus helveticus]NRO71135.1 hypothetical protein [Lactobacillus helveticus]PXZ20077.1 XRE family transcriptional regulator [Lactobacillus helveticus]
MIELERVKKLAKKYKLTLREVNDKAGLGTNSIYNWKKKRPGGDALEAVANVLNTSIDYLKGKTDDPEPTPDKGQVRSIPLDEEKPYSYHGYHVPERYLKMIRGLMEDDIKEGRANQNGNHQSK